MTTHSRWLVGVVLGTLAFCLQAQQEEGPFRGQPIENVTSGGQPDESELRAMAASGYTTVIDVRRPEEDRGLDERAVVEGLGMNYVSIPVDGANGVTFENAGLLNQILNETDGQVLIHCGSGNRAGALLSLREALNGADVDDAIATGRAGGLTRLEPTVRERLERRAGE